MLHILKDYSSGINDDLFQSFYLFNLYSFGKNIKIVHFVESQKPWTQYFDYGQSRVIGQPSQHPGNSSSAYHDAWWDRYRTLQDSAPFHHDNVDKDAEVL